MGRYTNGRITDYTQNFINIDVLCDVLTETQKEAGLEPTFKLKEAFRPKEDINKKCSKNCSSCKEHKKENSNVLFGALLGIDYDDDDDEEDFYLCEYCSSLGYKKDYIQEVCDQCTVCLSCNQYDTECSGCSYSRHRDGYYYSEKMSDEELLSESDVNIFKNVTSRNVDKGRLSIDSFRCMK